MFTSCTSFIGMLITFNDILTYFILSLIISVIIMVVRKDENKRRTFWISFIANLLLTPFAGFIYLIIQLTKKK